MQHHVRNVGGVAITMPCVPLPPTIVRQLGGHANADQLMIHSFSGLKLKYSVAAINRVA